ncbi:MAG: zinc-dependent alcohol dehydrogenase family protein [Spirochaetota bacterium]|nr:MAG: zinc-dependent alcohol dehydrogenase family protein [Spirochaetota bacterium]
MKAVVMEKTGGPEVLQLRDVPNPVIQKSREILVRIKAAGINPIDIKQRKRGTVYKKAPPHILGCDCAGVIEEKGRGVKRFDTGDEVFFMHGGIGKEPGTYAEYTVIDERFAVRKPKGVSSIEAGASSLAFLTAWESLFEKGKIKDGQTVLIQAGAGGVGHIAVQLAKQHGAKVCTTVSTVQKGEFVRQLGADRVILYKKEDFVKAVLDWTDGRGVDLALEMVGGDILFKTFSCVRLYGKVVTLLAPKGDAWWEGRLRNIDLAFVVVLTPMYYDLESLKEHHAELLKTCGEYLEQGKLKIHINKSFPLEQTVSAHREFERGHNTGKIVLSIDRGL